MIGQLIVQVNNMIIDHERPLAKHHDHPTAKGFVDVTINNTCPWMIIIWFNPFVTYPRSINGIECVNPIIDLCLLDLRKNWLIWIRTLKLFQISIQPWPRIYKSNLSNQVAMGYNPLYQGRRILSWSITTSMYFMSYPTITILATRG